jgi:geranylgeranyl reductase family protein
VVGGGPVGSEVAFKTASAGHSVIVLEKRKDYNARVCCTGIVSYDCINSFSIDKSLIKRYFSAANFFSPSDKKLRLEHKGPVAACLNRGAFDTFMGERAQKAGAKYFFSAEATSLEFSAGEVAVQFHQAGKKTVLEARVMVVAAGPVFSPLKEQPEFLAPDLIIGAQAIVEAPGVEEIEIYCGKEIAPGFFAWLVPTGDGQALIGLLARQKTAGYCKGFLTKLKGDKKIVTAEVDINYRAIALKPPQKTSGDRLIIVGSAAGQVKSTTGGGIYFGLLSADIAAGILDEALRCDDLSGGRLAAYEQAWRSKLMPELESGQRARIFYEHLSDPEMDALFNLGKMMNVEKILYSMDELSFDWHGRLISNLAKKYYNT